MEEALKKAIGEIVSDTIPGFESLLEKDEFDLKRIILYWENNSELKDNGKINEILSRTENLFLTTKFMIDRKHVKVKAMRNYHKYKREQLEGDYPIDVGKWLKSIYSRKFNRLESS